MFAQSLSDESKNRAGIGFLQAETTGGVILLGGTILALAWANSPWRQSYTHLWQSNIAVGIGSFTLSKPLLIWINDALMAVFFFVVGLEIKRLGRFGGHGRPQARSRRK